MMDYYKLKICENYWTLQKTTVDCKNSDKYEGKTKVLISPRGRASMWISDQGVLKVYTDKTIKDYFSDQEYKTLLTGYVSYSKDDGERVYYCSRFLNSLMPLIPSPSDECKELFEIIRRTKIQNSHKHKISSNLKNNDAMKDSDVNNFFGLFDDDE